MAPEAEAVAAVVELTRRKPSSLMRLATVLALAVVCLASLQVTVAQELDMEAILAASPAPSPTAGGNATGFSFGMVLLFSVLSLCFSSSFLLHFGSGYPM